jgi:hypothetical protein
MQILTSEVAKKEEIADASHACVHCKVKPAEIFQINGEYCLDCWQVITHTNA